MTSAEALTDDAPIVVATYPGFSIEDPQTAGVLREAGFAIRSEPRIRERTPVEVQSFMEGATAGIVSTDPFDADVFAGCPKLQVVARVGVGTDAIDLQAATAAGVAITVTPGLNTTTVADHTLALMLGCCRCLLQNDAAIRRGLWERGGALSGTDLSGSTVGIIGQGATGTAVARRLAGFDGVQAITTDLPEVPSNGLRRVELDELLALADIITLHVPLVPSTQGLIGARELALTRPGTILINTSRGRVVDEQALVAALYDGHLAAAGIDVFETEPPVDSPLLSMRNVILTPHIAGISALSQQAMIEMAVASILDVLAGRQPPGLLNPDALAIRRP